MQNEQGRGWLAQALQPTCKTGSDSGSFGMNSHRFCQASAVAVSCMGIMPAARLAQSAMTAGTFMLQASNRTQCTVQQWVGWGDTLLL